MRYASIADRALESGDFLHLYDDYTELPYANKPPVLFWLIAISLNTLGFSTFAARLPGAVFAACALFLLWRTANLFAGPQVAFFAVLLFVGNRTFFRSVVDLNFEGIVLCAGLIALHVAIEIVRTRAVTSRQAFLSGLSVALLGISKPPYLALFLPALFFTSFRLCGGKFVQESVWTRVVPFVIPVCIGFSWLFLVPSDESLLLGARNQVIEPLIRPERLLPNLSRWLEGYLFSLAPVSWIGSIIALRILFSRPTDEELLLISWATPIVPILLIAECRTRYLLVPIVALALLGGRWIAEKLPFFSERLQCAFMSVASVVVGALIFGLKAEFHSTNGIVTALREEPDLLAHPPMICVGDGKRGDVAYPSTRRVLILLRLEFRREFEVSPPQLLEFPCGASRVLLLVDEKCRRYLEAQQRDFIELRRYGEASLLEWRAPGVTPQ